MAKTTILMFCNQAGQQSSGPGRSTNQAQLQAVPGAESVDNAAIFEQGGSASLQLNLMKADEAKKYVGGRKVLVTIEDVE